MQVPPKKFFSNKQKQEKKQVEDDKDRNRSEKAFENWKQLNLYCSSKEQSQMILNRSFSGSSFQPFSLTKELEATKATYQTDKTLPPKKRKLMVVDWNDPKTYEPYEPQDPAQKLQELLSQISAPQILALILPK